MQMPATSTVYFQDMWKVSPMALQTSIVLNDLQEPYLDVYLNIKIEGVGMSIQSNPSIPVMPIRIYPGVPYFLTTTDMDAIFQSSRLIFRGYERSSWMRQLPFPEGNYRLEMEVVEWKSNVVVSNVAMQYTWLMLQDPPMLVFPSNEQVLEVTQPQWITFQWSPMHLLPVTYQVTYEFSLHKIYPTTLSPWQAVENTFPVYRVTTQQPFLVYGMAEPPLQKGSTYAWRVRIISGTNQQCFKNNGYSIIYTFQYGPPCTIPIVHTLTQENSQRVRMDWSKEVSTDIYEIDYRVQNSNEWIHVSSDSNEYIFTRWRPSTSYEIKIRSVCGTTTTDWSNVQTFQTGDSTSYRIQRCSPTTFPGVNENTTLSSLQVNDVFTMNGFKVKVLSVYGSPSSYSGYGVAYIPYIGVPIRMQLTNVAVSGGKAIQGRAVAVKADLSAYRVASTHNPFPNFCMEDVLNPSNSSSNRNGNSSYPLDNAFLTDTSKTNYYVINESLIWSENTSIVTTSNDTVALKSIVPTIEIGQTIQPVANHQVAVQSIRSVSLPTTALGCLRSLVDTILVNQQDSILSQLPIWKQSYEVVRNQFQQTLTQQYQWNRSEESDYVFNDLDLDDSTSTNLIHTITPEIKKVLMQDEYWQHYFTQYEAWQLKKQMLQEKAVVSIFIEEHPEASSRVPLYTFTLHQVESIADWELRTRQALCGLDKDWVMEVYQKFLPHLLIDLQNWE
ncbi:MAG: fibronectin type III domain-containing protein [Cytophagaceae bacterium]